MVSRRALALGLVLLSVLPVLGCVKGSSQATVAWNVSRPITDQDQTIPISIERGSCDTYERASVEETADQVTITAFVRRRNGACDLMLNFERVEVTLSAPIGTRGLKGCLPEGTCRTQTRPPYAPSAPTSSDP